MCKKATRSSLAMEAERRCLGDPVRCKQGEYIEAVGEELQQQTAMLASAIEDALDAVIKNKGRRCLVRRRSNLEAALESYERASVSLQQVADPDACEAATKDRRVLVDSSDDALDQIETLIEEKAEEKVGATEVRLQGDKLEEIGAKVWGQMSDSKSLERGEEAEVEVVEACGAKDGAQLADDKSLEPEQAVKIEVKQDLGGKLRGKFEVEETRATKDDPEFRAIKTKLQELRVLESNHEEEFGAEVELQMPAFGVLRFVGWVSRSLTMSSEYG